MTVAGVDRAAGPAERIAGLHLLDTDVHHDLPSYDELRPFLAAEWHPWIAGGGPGFARRHYSNVKAHIFMDDVLREADGLGAGDPDWVVEQLIRKYRIDVGVLTGTGLGVALGHNPRFCAALASAYNDWTLEKWVRPHACFKGSIVVTPQDPSAAAREIHRLGDDPGIVQVLVPSGAMLPYGQRHYWPIYAAAVEHDLPIAVHVGGEGTSIAGPPTAVGYPSSYLEFHTDNSQSMMAHCASLVTDGAFEEFPSLRFGFVEGGVCWAPYVMWRLDRCYPALKAEVPYLKHLPSEYILDHCYFSTQPIEEPADHRHLLQMFEMLRAERTVVFASDYPHWDFDNPLTAFSFFPAELRRRIFVDNVLAFYGPRLLGPST